MSTIAMLNEGIEDFLETNAADIDNQAMDSNIEGKFLV